MLALMLGALGLGQALNDLGEWVPAPPTLLPHNLPQSIYRALPLPLDILSLPFSNFNLPPSLNTLLHTTFINLILLDLTVPKLTQLYPSLPFMIMTSLGDQKEGLLAAKRIFISIDSGEHF